MSIKSRLKSVEQQSGIGSDVEGQVFHTIYEDKEGFAESETAFATFFSKGLNRTPITITQSADESREEFESRVETECLAAFGNLPDGW